MYSSYYTFEINAYQLNILQKLNIRYELFVATIIILQTILGIICKYVFI